MAQIEQHSTEQYSESSVSASKARIHVHQRGFSVVELLVVVSVSSLVVLVFMSISIYLYGDTLRASTHSQLAAQSQTVLRSIVEDVRQGSAIKATNSNTDANAPTGGWATNSSTGTIIIATPSLTSANNFIINSGTGKPYQDEIVYFVSGTTIYKRTIANASAAGNAAKTSCPAALSSASCPADAIVNNRYKSMIFSLFDQDNASTTTIANARSIAITLQLERVTYSNPVNFTNTIQITLRNTN